MQWTSDFAAVLVDDVWRCDNPAWPNPLVMAERYQKAVIASSGRRCRSGLELSSLHS
jgi:hypothetical protein